MTDKYILIGAGFKPKKEVIKFLFKHNYNKIIAADGGAEHCRRLNLIPDFIIGDLDSISATTINKFKNKTKIIQIARQSDTDTEKCIKFLIENKIKSVALLSLIGSRLDHSLSNLGLILKYSSKINFTLFHFDSVLFPISSEMTLKSIRNETISLQSFSPDVIVKTEGLKYKINNENLFFGKKDSISNVSNSDEVVIQVYNGNLFLIREFKVIKKIGIF